VVFEPAEYYSRERLIKTHKAKQRPSNNISTVKDKHYCESALARGSLRLPSCGVFSMRAGKTQNLFVLKIGGIISFETSVFLREANGLISR
jgi:hypothetical protein